MAGISRMIFRWLTPAGLVAIIISVACAADWSSCADDLDRLRRASRDAADAAEQVKSKSDELESCRQFPEVYDLLRDRCRSYAWDYQSAVSALSSELSTVDSRVRSANLSCGYELSTFGPPAAKRGSDQRGTPAARLCALIQSYRGRIPDDQLVQLCAGSMPETECRKCLSSP
jgi:hypothetical protein